ncbi:hypothetical protein Avbf_01490 [Armadillidium vulgare]|nr:hypothetical protein Avbf_01490 [Armadillidium vulgare]
MWCWNADLEEPSVTLPLLRCDSFYTTFQNSFKVSSVNCWCSESQSDSFTESQPLQDDLLNCELSSRQYLDMIRRASSISFTPPLITFDSPKSVISEKFDEITTNEIIAKTFLPAVDRGTTPERVEFENSVIEHSDEEEYLSEEEWTDRNFGASANELDDDDDSDYSDLRYS